jgi:salicylate hydroxylase
MLFKSRGNGNFQYCDWLYGQDAPGIPALSPGSPIKEAAAV